MVSVHIGEVAVSHPGTSLLPEGRREVVTVSVDHDGRDDTTTIQLAVKAPNRATTVSLPVDTAQQLIALLTTATTRAVDVVTKALEFGREHDDLTKRQHAAMIDLLHEET